MTNLQTDKELMKAYLTGDELAFAVIYERYSGKIYSYLQKKLRTREEADEVFQKVFLKFHKTRKNYDSQHPLLQWLYVVAKTTLFDHFRLQNRQIKTDDTPLEEINSLQVSQEPSSEALIIGSDVSILRTLSHEQRTAVEMRIIDECSYEQIALTLNKSQQGVRQIISRALKKIRRTA